LDAFDPFDYDRQTSLLKEILCDDKHYHTISITHFGSIIEWFGPITIDRDNLLQRILKFLKSPWFHYDMERDVANEQLNIVNKKKNRFLIRLNMKEKRCIHPMTLSYILNDEPMHVRILYIQDEDCDLKKYNITVQDLKNNQVKFESYSLLELIETIKVEMKIKSVTETNKYIKKYFSPLVGNTLGYINTTQFDKLFQTGEPRKESNIT